MLIDIELKNKLYNDPSKIVSDGDKILSGEVNYII